MFSNNEDQFFDEVNTINEIISSIANHEEPLVYLIWVEIFRATPTLIQLKIIVSKVLTIPISNAFNEKKNSMNKNL
jgi:ABC-type amino acid transport system permease subunit